MLIPLLVALTVAAASPEAPVTVLLAPPDASGVPRHIAEFAQEHVAQQLKSRDLQVVRIEEVTRKLTARQRKAVLRCDRTEAGCIVSLGAAGKTEVVVVSEVVPFLSGFRAGIRAYQSRDGQLLAANQVSGVKEDQLLDGLTQALDVVVPKVKNTLRPPPPVVAPPPPPVVAAPSLVVPPQPVVPVTPERAAPTHTWKTPTGIVGVSAGALAIAAGVLFSTQAKSSRDDIDAAYRDNPAGPTQEEVRGSLSNHYDDLKRQRTLALASGGVGLVLAGVGAYLWLSDGPPERAGSTRVIAGPTSVGVLVRLP
ncbi:hypothetical protein KRR26_27240 [Corallococcus sp. M34]|uniref:hypothetical protein n=1 Tax=Citreicoccus inhibens TaxID=2849499 RepID=UPI0011C3E74B|nr:hypothetical protein [Citreicoccus inhibens]MBU8899318.1 hypothetical protein [Citreicoccus inhibens]